VKPVTARNMFLRIVFPNEGESTDRTPVKARSFAIC
jgi:hypothetical protein